ncbi:MAG: hypothetical protein ABI768_06510, partial [Acidobacteriota bacterium]
MRVERSGRSAPRLVLFAEIFFFAFAAGSAVAQTAQTGNVFNPNISVIGNALGFVGHNPADNQPSL